MSLTIGESSAVVTLLHFFNPRSEDRPEVEKAQAALTMLRDRAGKALQVSGPAIINDAELEGALRVIDEWINYDQDFEADAAIEDVDTHGRT